MEYALDFLRRNIQELGEFLVVELRKELKGQGHEATGKLSRELEAVVKDFLNATEVEINHLQYGVYIDQGVRADRIPFRKGSGAKSSRYIDALIRWVRIKGFTSGLDKDIRGAAFAIANKQKRYGMPIPLDKRAPGGRGGNTNGRVKGWLDYVYTQNLAIIEQRLKEVSATFIEMAFENVLNRIASQHQLITIS